MFAVRAAVPSARSRLGSAVNVCGLRTARLQGEVVKIDNDKHEFFSHIVADYLGEGLSKLDRSQR